MKRFLIKKISDDNWKVVGINGDGMPLGDGEIDVIRADFSDEDLSYLEVSITNGIRSIVKNQQKHDNEKNLEQELKDTYTQLNGITWTEITTVAATKAVLRGLVKFTLMLARYVKNLE